MQEPEIPKDLVDAIRNGQCVLFVGAGISRESGLPLFDLLQDRIRMDFDIKNEFCNFATLMEFVNLTASPKYKESLYAWIHETWNHGKPSHLHHQLLQLNFPLIYTTNYDHLIEDTLDELQKPWHSIVTVSDLTTISSSKTQIVKFHGDFNMPETMVISESGYMQRMDLDTPLDLKLRADTLASPILFVGYSLSDPNIRYLLWKLNHFWKDNPTIRPRSYLLLVQPDPVQETILSSWNIESLKSNSAKVFFDKLVRTIV